MPDWMIYAGCTGGALLIGAGCMAALGEAYRLHDRVRNYTAAHDAWARIAIGAATALLCAAWGAIYASRSEVMGHDAVIGALWGLGGAAGVALGLGPVITARLRREIEERRER